MSDDTQIAKMGQSLPKTNQPQQPIQANLNQYGNESTQIAYVQHYDATTNQTPNKALLAKRILLCSLFAGKETG